MENRAGKNAEKKDPGISKEKKPAIQDAIIKKYDANTMFNNNADRNIFLRVSKWL